ncbi:ribonuclease E/G [Acidaminobacter hydrogenoformans]|uniref:Ribonuclease, Rne/Rng family n=1 Tax=Acidaminobacter hydrogenoformans DSM 2784 TaxID=1120920 RepID=A0A1G5RSY2_9FIRM|nr:ribonuclease E/G [Acidaminobacter hydrogenoformans]SCZ77202.1 ribonuclease, Rne/Rng family [Acidaminobacter hydrogenoformans DSM 2784]
MREIFIDSHFLFKRTALVESGKLSALTIEPLISEPLDGAIFLGRVTAIVESLEAAFVDIGLDQDAFLPFQDLPDRLNKNSLKNGSELLVQLKTEGNRFKGPKVTGRLELQGRYLVLMPETHQKSISRKLRDNEKRTALMTLVDEAVGALGYIVRTEGTLAEPSSVAEEAQRLKKVWEGLSRAYVTVKAPKCVEPGLSASQRLLLTHLVQPGTSLVLADPGDAADLDNFFRDYGLEASAKDAVKGKKRNPLLFEQFYHLEKQMQDLLDKKAEFDGAYLLIEPTEAFLAVDVNAGSAAYNSRKSAVMKRQINEKAILECLRQLELRNTGGMVMMDLIDAEGEREREHYNLFLKKTLRNVFSGIFGAEVNRLGVLSLTRRRMGKSLSEIMLSPCGCCGSGWVLSAAAQMDRLLRDAVRDGRGVQCFRVSSGIFELTVTLAPLISKIEQAFDLQLKWEKDEQLNFLPIQYKKTL